MGNVPTANVGSLSHEMHAATAHLRQSHAQFSKKGLINAPINSLLRASGLSTDGGMADVLGMVVSHKLQVPLVADVLMGMVGQRSPKQQPIPTAQLPKPSLSKMKAHKRAERNAGAVMDARVADLQTLTGIRSKAEYGDPNDVLMPDSRKSALTPRLAAPVLQPQPHSPFFSPRHAFAFG